MWALGEYAGIGGRLWPSACWGRGAVTGAPFGWVGSKRMHVLADCDVCKVPASAV